MDFFRGGFLAKTEVAEPPSVFAEWNKYSTGDIESRGAEPAVTAAQPSTSVSMFSFVPGSAGASTSSAPPPPPSSAPSFRIPSGTEFIYFAAMLCGAGIFFFMAFFVFLPMLVLSPAKFALAFTCGSFCTMAAMMMLSGWKAGLAHMVSQERLPFTAIYLGSMAATLYAAVSMRSYILSLGFSVVQVFALLYYILSYFPGGAQGMQFILGMLGRALTSCIGSTTRTTR